MMAGQSLEARMDNLERRVEILGQLPAQVAALGSQILQLREEMRDEFSTTRAETRSAIEESQRTLREEIRAVIDDSQGTLRKEIRAGDEETRRYMRVLHEDLVARIAMLGRG
jgi:recombinational DNA repair ATPase RecF